MVQGTVLMEMKEILMGTQEFQKAESASSLETIPMHEKDASQTQRLDFENGTQQLNMSNLFNKATNIPRGLNIDENLNSVRSTPQIISPLNNGINQSILSGLKQLNPISDSEPAQKQGNQETEQDNRNINNNFIKASQAYFAEQTQNSLTTS